MLYKGVFAHFPSLCLTAYRGFCTIKKLESQVGL